MAKSAGESNFNTFLNKNIKPETEKMRRTDKMADFKRYMDNPANKLGRGAFGKVFKVRDNGKWCALK